MEPRSASSLSLSLSFCISLPGVPAACEGQESSRVGGLGRPVPRPSARSICLVRRLGLMPRPAPAAVGSQFFSKAVEFQAPRGSREGPAPGRADFSRCQAGDMRQLPLRCRAIASRATARCESGRRVGLASKGPRHRSIISPYTSQSWNLVLSLLSLFSLSLSLSVSLLLEFLPRARGTGLAEWAGLTGSIPTPVHGQCVVLSDDSD
ncbi:unnamed protein product [Prorocentrum cordatum]|uniref:Uncharacterized protein n=1 Tax=Prorocentrum cordatum TaxID=2364126 RepID=A0ABN9QP08_9DINO|nr:unnamed protein product [Polarella glacialis]